MTKPTAFEEAERRFATLRRVMSVREEREWFFNAGRQAERDEWVRGAAELLDAQIVPPEDTKREQEKP